MAVLCIQPPPRFGDARSIVEKILSAGRVWVAAATFEGREIIRACVTHGETTPDDVIELVNALDAAGVRLDARDEQRANCPKAEARLSPG